MLVQNTHCNPMCSALFLSSLFLPLGLLACVPLQPWLLYSVDRQSMLLLQQGSAPSSSLTLWSSSPLPLSLSPPLCSTCPTCFSETHCVTVKFPNINGGLDPSVRKQAVGVEGRLAPVPVVSGVPQGTLLGPCLFLVHLMGLSDNISEGTSASSFADDTQLQRGILEEHDCEMLQNDLDNVYCWAEDIGMMFNAGKFELLRFWTDRDAAPDILYLAPDGSPIEEKDCLRDLGVRVSTDLTFNTQIDLTVESGSRMAGWALRTFRGRGRQLMLTLLRSLVQPRLDYCSQLWSPRDQASINRLEDVQRQFLSKVWDPVLQNMNYWEKLSSLRVYSQERRRERYQICFLWKLSQGLVEGYSMRWQWSDRRGRLAVPNHIPQTAPTKVMQARERSLGVHGARLFNLLPLNIRNENSGDFPLFKNHLDIFLGSIPDQPTTPGLVRAALSNSLLEQVPLVPDIY